MNIFCLLSNYCFLVVLGDGVQFEILHFQMNFFSIPRILTPSKRGNGSTTLLRTGTCKNTSG